MAAARKTDPYTSHLAASQIMDATTLQIRILECFYMTDDGLTHEELIALYKRTFGLSFPASDSSIRSRVAELRDRAVIVATSKRRGTQYGNKSIVWNIEGRLL